MRHDVVSFAWMGKGIVIMRTGQGADVAPSDSAISPRNRIVRANAAVKRKIEDSPMVFSPPWVKEMD
jgi:hypothetical protein